jgi:hypothetical protein
MCSGLVGFICLLCPEFPALAVRVEERSHLLPTLV